MAIRNITIKRYDGAEYDTYYPATSIEQVADLQDELDDKQDNLIDLSTFANNKYLHTNSSTGALEWAEVSTVEDVKVDGVSVVTNRTANISLTGKENTIILSVPQPTTQVSGDFWYEKIADTYTITNNLTNITASASNPTTMTEGTTITLTYTAASGYALPDTVTVSGATGSWNSVTGILTLTDSTDNITITMAAIGTVLCFTANTAGSTVAMAVTGTPTLSQNFSYSTDKSTWSTFTPGTTTVTLTNAGDKVYFKGNNPNGVNQSTSIYYKFVVTGSIAASGNIMSLIDNGACTTTTIPNDYCFCRLFWSCEVLTAPPTLPATVLTSNCYAHMFYRCFALTTPPTLPALILAQQCYTYMFSFCTALAAAPALQAMTLATGCYKGMFYSCSSLNTPPSLPATTLVSECYYSMFHSCSSLTTAPELPATTLASGCYYSMFSTCTSLATAPVLPATTLASDCYNCMFYNCSALTTAPALPATTLATNCYYWMFANCTKLTSVPALPATTLPNSCYYKMFYGCTSLQVNDSPVSGTAEKEWVIPSAGTIVSTASYAGQLMFDGCAKAGTRASNDMPAEIGLSYTYYTQNAPIG